MADGQANFYNFSNMHYDLSKVGPDKLVIDVFPELQHNKAYTEATDIEIRIALLMCDPRGPFRDIKQYSARLDNVCRFLRIDVTDKEKELYQQILELKSVNVANVWAAYLETVFNHEWVSWFSSSLIYYQMQVQLQKPIDFEDDKAWDRRSKIESRVDAVYKRMKAMEAIVFVDDELKRRSFEAAKDKIENWPEKFADDNSVI